MKQLFTRVNNRPLLTPEDVPFPAGAVLNPGAIEHDGGVVLLLRVEDTTGVSNIHAARSRNGVDGWEIAPEPLLRAGEPGWPHEAWGCEDPRITRIDEDDCWYVTYTGASPFGAAVGIARTQDFTRLERLGTVLSPPNKDAVLYPRRFGGRYVMLHRPDVGDQEHIWSAHSPDMRHWGEPRCLLEERGGVAWDGLRIGAGPPPLLTERGWLLIYHGVKGYGGRLLYRAGVALFDRDEPTRLLRRGPSWVFQAREDWELRGLVPGAIFPTGLIRRGDELWVYYGVSDMYVGLAIAKLDEVLAVLDEPDGG